MKARFRKRGEQRLFRSTLLDLRRMRGCHDRWTRLGEFHVAAGRRFDPRADGIAVIRYEDVRFV